MNILTEHQKALATVLDRESAATARYDAKIDALEAENLSLWELLEGYRDSCSFVCTNTTHRCSICRKYDALESKD